MAGPGGGGSSGGGFGGGSFGGGGFSGGGGRGFGGGSFGGGHNGGSFGGHHHHGHHHHHGPHYYGPFFGRRTYVGGGCGGGLFTLVVIGMFIIFGAIWLFAEPGEIIINGQPVYVDGGVAYDEGTMQDYANERYKEAFGEYEGYEDNILLVFLANEAADGYYTIAWVGDNIKPEINTMFGEYTEYGQYMNQYINTDYYGYTLDQNLAGVVAAMEKSIIPLVRESGTAFNSPAAAVEEKKSELINYTQFEITKDTVDSAIASFRETTGIPLVIVVDMAERVFGGKEYESNSVVKYDNEVSAIQTEALENEGYKTVAVRKISYAPLLLVAGVVIGAVVAIAITKNKKTKPSDSKKTDNNMPWES